jgi:ATP-binding cassette subfamily B protein
VEVSTESLDAPDELVETDEPPRFWKVAGHYRRLALCALAFVLLAAMGGIAPSLLFGRVTDIIQQSDGQDASSAYVWALVLVGIGVATGIAYRYFLIFANRFTHSVIVVLRRRVFRRLTRLGVNFYDRELPGDVATRVVADLDMLLTFAQEAGFRLISFIAIFVVAMAAILVVAPGVTVTVLVMLLIMVIVTVLQLPFANHALTWSRQELGVVTRKFHEDFGARHEIRHLGAEAVQTRKFVEASWERRRARWWAAIIQNSHGAVLQFLGTMTTALVLYEAGTLVLDQKLTIGAAVTVQLLATAAAQPLALIPQLYNQMLDVRVSWRRLCEPFAEPIFPEHNPAEVPCPTLDGPVSFEAVRFAYPGTERPVLRDVSFTMEPGQITALVGYTGAGKSSIAKLLARTYDPDGGAVTLNGIDLRHLDPDSFRPHLGIVPQDPFVFHGTVASNVRYSKLDATDAEVENAVRAVGAWDLLSALAGGLDHPVEEEGHNLTAAQRQLIALARAWLARPDILVLDEATSLLDTEVEDVIISALHELRCTTLMITHRETVAAKSDSIVVLQAGRVVDSGPEAEVARPGGPYDALWRIQEHELAQERDQLLATGAGDGQPPG